MNPWCCDDDAGEWDDSHICWEEIEEFAGPMYRMWRQKLDDETPVWRDHATSSYWWRGPSSAVEPWGPTC